jgi:predicted transcriptional regulator
MKRGKAEIARNVLLICKQDAATKNRIICRANLNSKTASVHLNWLMDRELIMKEENVFRITPKGAELLSNLSSISPLLA